MNKILPLGKLPAHLLSELIPLLPTSAPEIVIPPNIGCDAGGLTIGNQLVAVTTDPITFSTNHLATYSVSVNINDIACMGARPRWYTATLLLPPDTTENTVRQIWRELGEQLKKYDLFSIGGHCEVTDAVTKPIIIGQMIGEAIGDALLNPKNARAGDKIYLWQPAGIEGTALLALEHAEKLKSFFSAEKIATMQNLIHEPGICVWPFVKQLLPNKNIVALHDPTEGGIATALHELADAAHCGFQVKRDAIPVLPETATLAKILNFDPLGLLASGSLLIVSRSDSLEADLKELGLELMPILIGELTENPARTLPRYDQDEIVNALKIL